MCELDESPRAESDPHPNRPYDDDTGRRAFLRTGLLAVASLTALGRAGAQILRTSSAYAAGSVAPAGLTSFLNAMHIHSSYSEGSGSYDSHLSEAARCGVQVMWPTDHDWRMNAINYVTTLRFLKSERSNGVAVTYHPGITGTVASSTASLVTSPASPNDPAGGAAHLAARSTGTAPAWAGLNVHPPKQLRTGISGTYLRFDINPVTVGPNAWGEVLLTHSYHPARSGRPGGQYQIAYRFGTRSGYETRGLLGIVWLSVTPGSGWTTFNLSPEADLARLWPDMAGFAGDNNMFDMWFRAGSQSGSSADVFFANALIDRTRSQGDEPLTAQSELLDVLGPMYGVTVRRGLEVSLNAKHSNWFGGAFHMPDYDTLGTGIITAETTRLIHGYGGLASFNHPFGVQLGALDVQSAQDSRRRTVAATLIGNRCYGTDIIEAGYHKRGGATLETHLALADSLARNGVWLTYDGVSDNHVGTALSWSKEGSHDTFVTGLWASSTAEGDLLDALRAGRAYCGELGVFQGQLWLDVDGAPMGSVSISQASTRTLSIAANQLPASGYIEVVQGAVDYRGPAVPEPGTLVVSTVDVGVLRAAGAATVSLDTSRSSFVRLNLFDSSLGRRTAFTSPTWLLREQPPTAIPGARAA